MTTQSQQLDGKVALITGSSLRIGASIASTLHAQGAKLVLHYRHSRDAAHELQQKLNDIRSESVILVQANLLECEKLSALIKEAHTAWGQLDILVNNASSFYPTPIETATEEQWNELIGSNVKAPFFLSKAAAPHLKESEGCIINIVDIHAERPLKQHPIYSIAKAGLAMMTKSLAYELGPEIRVNGVAPGAILWPEPEMDDITKQRIISKTFLKRRGSPENIADAVLFLASQAVYTTGHIINVDGGRSLNS